MLAYKRRSLNKWFSFFPLSLSLISLWRCRHHVLFFVRVPPLGWLGVMIIVLFFVHVPPLGWLGAMIIVLFFVSVPPLGWLGDIIIVFIIVIECVRLSCFVQFLGASVFNVCEVGFDSPTKLVSGDPLVYW